MDFSRENVVADAHRATVHADEKWTTFLELELAIRTCGGFCVAKLAKFLSASASIERSEFGGRVKKALLSVFSSPLSDLAVAVFAIERKKGNLY